jgi:hypothetical protein
MWSLEFFEWRSSSFRIWQPWGPLSIYHKWVPSYFLGGKDGRCVRLTTLPPSCAGCENYRNLSLLESSGHLGIPLPFVTNKAAVIMRLVCVPTCPFRDTKPRAFLPQTHSWNTKSFRAVSRTRAAVPRLVLYGNSLDSNWLPIFT